ncbi:ComF family protein [Francisella adeliensis]|uniref:Amidophosphoribosyltransferase n=1 Tax=Francisella adeliensis TaxID=2007306 RepID=A0A2Z4XWY6_9GAMM|nr:phosphoribosyltransferase family protein [Francisella adeliensis]AXA33226.1 amidophosphoribosyltransferase [Francisella adeliensis]MBK2085053.1 ComF family protein [Francisella adeliensis]MBK2096956.1 ComF family protein [Francisella adeliensis]QIW11454.1 ComF family protein [Francisella adeliensis]QIW13329.1 ComF family protein [Francisella adeliensis]
MSFLSFVSSLVQKFTKQNCLLCHQSSDEVICNYCFDDMASNLHLTKEQVELDVEYDYFYLSSYSIEMKFLLQKLKFSKDLLIVPIFEKLFDKWWGSFANKHLVDVDAIAVVPSHRLRYLYRGFNQAEVIAQSIADKISITTTFEHYKRSKYTKPQSKSSKAQRAEQISGVFELTKPITAKHLIVFDDVLTTGSTLKEFIATIKEGSKIEKISVVTLVRVG